MGDSPTAVGRAKRDPQNVRTRRERGGVEVSRVTRAGCLSDRGDHGSDVGPGESLEGKDPHGDSVQAELDWFDEGATEELAPAPDRQLSRNDVAVRGRIDR